MTSFRPATENYSFSKPSSPVVSMNLPQIKDFNVEFIYNYYVADERTNENPRIPEYLKRNFVEQNNANFIDYSLRVPRYVRLRWELPKGPIATATTSLENNSNNSIQANLQKIQTEESFLHSKYSSHSIANHDAIQDANTEINSIAGNNLPSLFNTNSFFNSKDGFSFFSPPSTQGDNSQITLLNNSVNGKPRFVRLTKDSKKNRNDFPNSLLTISKQSKYQLVDSKKAGFSPFSIADTFNSNILKETGDKLKNDASTKKDIKSSTESVENIAVDPFKLNGVAFYDASKKNLKKPNSGFKKILDTIQKNPFQLQLNKLAAIDVFSSSSISSQDYKKINDNFLKTKNKISEIDDVFSQPIYVGSIITNPDFFEPSIGIIGYIIERFILSEKGFVKEKTYTVENPRIDQFIDTAVLFGRAYQYSIRTIFKISTTGFDEEVNEIREMVYYVGSKTTETSIKTFEYVPPPPPVDLSFMWDYKDKKLQIAWCMPVNSQRDIKQFQVFRRESVEEPFELISQKCFDFSTLKYNTGESIDGNSKDAVSDLVEYSTEPILFHVDDDFKINPSALKASKYIYSIVSIDAHGMSSNYSAQFEVTFDFYKNTLIKKLISSAGAPKPYPNLYLRIDAFKDVIKTSGESSMKLKVYFMPEYFKIRYGDSRIQRMVSTKQDNSYYKIQFINLQNQKSDSLKIVIDDPLELTK